MLTCVTVVPDVDQSAPSRTLELLDGPFGIAREHCCVDQKTASVEIPEEPLRQDLVDEVSGRYEQGDVPGIVARFWPEEWCRFERFDVDELPAK